MPSILVNFDAMHIGNILPLAIIVLVVMGAAVAFLSPGRKAWFSHINAKPLMTPNEIEFFQRLKRALPAYQVFPQVSFAAILTDVGKLSSKARWSVRARFDRKIADFVICERGGFKVVALIELDDRTTRRNPTASAMPSPTQPDTRLSGSSRSKGRAKPTSRHSFNTPRRGKRPHKLVITGHDDNPMTRCAALLMETSIIAVSLYPVGR